MWERFSYYGMNSLLVLFLVSHANKGGFGWLDGKALTVYGIYSMLLYVMGVPGGIIADRYLGLKKTVLLGGIIQCIGHGLLALGNETLFFMGLGCIIVGVGLLKPNISTMVGDLYAKNDVRRDAGFSLFYMGINIGGMLAPLVVGFVGEIYGWHYGFGLAGIGMLVGIMVFLVGQPYLKTVVVEQATKASSVATKAPFTKQEKDRILALLFSFVAVFIFFVAFKQAGGLMTLYAKKYTNRYLFDWEIPASMLQSLNPGFVICFSLAVAALWSWLSKKFKHITSIYKMGIANIIMGMGFVWMIMAVLQKNASATQESALIWIVLTHFFHTIAELSLSPVGLSFVTKIAPQRIVSSMMGIYFAVIGFACFTAGQIGKLATTWGELVIFQFTAITGVCVGIIFIIFHKKLRKLIHGLDTVV